MVQCVNKKLKSENSRKNARSKEHRFSRSSEAVHVMFGSICLQLVKAFKFNKTYINVGLAPNLAGPQHCKLGLFTDRTCGKVIVCDTLKGLTYSLGNKPIIGMQGQG